MIYVRTAGARDVEAIGALLRRTWHDTYDAIYGAEKVEAITARWHSPEALSRQLCAPQSEFLVADDGEAIAGMAFARTEAGDEAKVVNLVQLCVLPDMQGRGIGGLLLDEIEGCFPGARTLRAEVEPRNAKAVAFYVAQGFAKAGERLDGEMTVEIYERPIVWA